MVSSVIPEILYNHRFWLIIGLGLSVVVYFARRKSPPPFPKAGKFFKRHKRDIKKITDIFIIFMVLLWFPVFSVRDVFTVTSESEPTGTMAQQLDLTSTFMLLIIWSGISGFFIGFLSIFQSNITKIKRIILLMICLLPIALTILQVLTGNTEYHWLTTKLCLMCSVGSWIINTPAVIAGRSSYELLGNMVKKMKLMLSHHAN